ncbi:hypothetical protein GQX74_004750 [Glossina fuscipes]|nr:hypothetical protein GQX74_004750 [Glossina fuscipes]
MAGWSSLSQTRKSPSTKFSTLDLITRAIPVKGLFFYNIMESVFPTRIDTMVSTGALIVVAALHVLLSLSFFIEQEADQCSTAPTIASWIFLIGLFDILWDMCIFPPRYAHLPSICRIIWEIIFAILITEFGTIIVWCQIEKLCCRLTKFMLLIMGLYPISNGLNALYDQLAICKSEQKCFTNDIKTYMYHPTV